MNKHFFQRLSGLIVAVFVFSLLSCSVYRPKVMFKASPYKIYQGDSVKVSRVVKKSKKITKISLNNEQVNLSFRRDTFIKFSADTLLVFKVFGKNSSKPVVKRRKIRVYQPKINAFAAYRDRFDPQKVHLVWNVQGVKNVRIEGFKTNLPFSGEDSLVMCSNGSFNLVASTKFMTVQRTCFVNSVNREGVYVYKDSSLDDFSDNRQIMMKITETDIVNYPTEVKLKVIVYDTTGNFITHLAPPYGDTETAKKYFRRITEMVDKTAQNIEFSVKEIHEASVPYDISLVLDYSGSMSGNIKTLEKSSSLFIKDKHPDDRYSLVKFDNKLVRCSSLESDPYQLIKECSFKGLDTLGGSTALYAATNMGVRTLKDSHKVKAIVLFTDGYENASMRYIYNYAATINQVIDTIRKNNTKLFIIGLGDVNNQLLRELAYCTNGIFYAVKNPNEINEVYKELTHNLRVYYEIDIKPMEKNAEHNIQLEYYNNKEVATVERPYYIGNSVDFMKYEEDTAAYWYIPDLKQKRYKLAFAPQSLVNFDLDRDNIRSEYRVS